MLEENKVCCECGASMVESLHSFGDGTQNLLLVLIRCFEPYEPFHLRKSINLTNLQYTGLSKLQYWGLIEKHYADGIRMSGVWKLTNKAKDFLHGKPLPKWVKTFRGVVTEFSEDMYTCSLDGFIVPPKWEKEE